MEAPTYDDAVHEQIEEVSAKKKYHNFEELLMTNDTWEVKETILKPGLRDVTMSYRQSEKEVKEHIVNNEEILIGRNDEEGYYFKFGIYLSLIHI